MNPKIVARRTVDDATVTEMLRILGRFRRRLRRAAPPSFDDRLTAAQVEILRLIARRPGISIGEAAAELGLADNTVSTLAIQLVKQRLLVRRADPEDRRVGRLSLAGAAQRDRDLARERRHVVLAEVLALLDDTTYATLLRGLDALSAATAAFDGREAGK
jgi:DNA-binding MarR family transcriptional regulator